MSASQSSNDTNQNQSITDIILQPTPQLDHRASIVTPFEQETADDADFQEKLNDILLDLMIEFHAWASARPAHEREQMTDSLENEVNAAFDMEREQGTSRQLSYVEQTKQKLAAFVEKVRSAIALLTS